MKHKRYQYYLCSCSECEKIKIKKPNYVPLIRKDLKTNKYYVYDWLDKTWAVDTFSDSVEEYLNPIGEQEAFIEIL